MHSRVCTVSFRSALYSPRVFGSVSLFQCSQSEVTFILLFGYYQQARYGSVLLFTTVSQMSVYKLPSPHFLPSVHLGVKVGDPLIPSSPEGL